MSLKIYTRRIDSRSQFRVSKVIVSFIFAIAFSLISFKDLSFYNPLWVVLLLIYWHLRLDIKDSYNNLYYAFILGVVCDLVFNNAIGILAFSYVSISYILSVLKPISLSIL